MLIMLIVKIFHDLQKLTKTLNEGRAGGSSISFSAMLTNTL